MNTVSFDYTKTNGGVAIERYRGAEPVVDVPYSIAGKAVKKISAGAFAGCKEIKRVNIPFSVEEIAVDAFAGCKNLQEIFWNSELIKLGGGDVIKRTGNEIQIPASWLKGKPQEPAARGKLLKTPVDEFSYSVDDSGVVIEKYFGDAEIVVVPPKIDNVPVVRVGFGAFGGCKNLRELRLPSTLLSISSRALDGCESLKIIYTPESLLADFESCKLFANLPKNCIVRYK